MVFSESSAVPINQTPASCNSRIARAKLVTATKGIVSAAPLATLLTVVLSCAERSLGTRMASAPAPSATRKHAPKLCGSVTPSRIKSKAFFSPKLSSSSATLRANDAGSAKATTPW